MIWHPASTFHFKSPDPHKTAQWYVDNLGAKLSHERDLTRQVLDANFKMQAVWRSWRWSKSLPILWVAQVA